MNKIIETASALGLTAALLVLPACDKGGADEAAKTDDKAAKADKAEKPEAGEKPGAGEKPEGEVAELGGDGRVDVIVDAGGYHPDEIRAPAKSKVTLAFTRTTEQGCGQDLVIASMEIDKKLPLNETVEIEVEVPETGEVKFACGMDMYRGKVVPKS
ncbi:hypothetical protein ENSA5_63120 [Enhygromyxa salina]|uniref:EfeO-type cupredoxin-like domain-containing protein n=1 Tax=Enhygromyxa salina TaxID=215803 RepID=A0A2S9XD82_9BACT|nr:cupredoxin domain-containing protein [Enhygromyxa salina]PRP90641.1 hypothetical protein ENSA5_63120 [Enhygromyxa salina]